MKTYKGVIFFDIDGTLTDSGHGKANPSEEVIRAIRQVRKNGYACVICTGRNLGQVSCTDVLSPDGYVFSDGAGIRITGQEPVLQAFPDDVVRTMLEGVACHHGGQNISSAFGFYATPFAEKVQRKLVERMTAEHPEEKESIEHDFIPLPITEWKGEPILETDIYFPCEEDEQAWLKDKNPMIQYTHMSTEPSLTYAEATFHVGSKGDGCRKITGMLGCSMKDTYAFGDSMNDSTAIEAVHTGIAMGNAQDELKKIADYVTDTVQNDGIVSGLKHFHLI